MEALVFEETLGSKHDDPYTLGSISNDPMMGEASSRDHAPLQQSADLSISILTL